MFTIKHVISAGGFETVYAAKQVRVKRKDLDNPMSTRCVEFVEFDCPNGDVRTIDNGKIYVMNEDGRTVASYEIGKLADSSVGDMKKAKIGDRVVRDGMVMYVTGHKGQFVQLRPSDGLPAV